MPDDDIGHLAVLKQIWFDDKITLERAEKKKKNQTQRLNKAILYPRTYNLL